MLSLVPIVICPHCGGLAFYPFVGDSSWSLVNCSLSCPVCRNWIALPDAFRDGDQVFIARHPGRAATFNIRVIQDLEPLVKADGSLDRVNADAADASGADAFVRALLDAMKRFPSQAGRILEKAKLVFTLAAPLLNSKTAAVMVGGVLAYVVESKRHEHNIEAESIRHEHAITEEHLRHQHALEESARAQARQQQEALTTLLESRRKLIDEFEIRGVQCGPEPQDLAEAIREIEQAIAGFNRLIGELRAIDLIRSYENHSTRIFGPNIDRRFRWKSRHGLTPPPSTPRDR